MRRNSRFSGRHEGTGRYDANSVILAPENRAPVHWVLKETNAIFGKRDRLLIVFNWHILPSRVLLMLFQIAIAALSSILPAAATLPNAEAAGAERAPLACVNPPSERQRRPLRGGRLTCRVSRCWSSLHWAARFWMYPRHRPPLRSLRRKSASCSQFWPVSGRGRPMPFLPPCRCAPSQRGSNGYCLAICPRRVSLRRICRVVRYLGEPQRLAGPPMASEPQLPRSSSHSPSCRRSWRISGRSH